jgi:hypothetical protein
LGQVGDYLVRKRANLDISQRNLLPTLKGECALNLDLRNNCTPFSQAFMLAFAVTKEDLMLGLQGILVWV